MANGWDFLISNSGGSLYDSFKSGFASTAPAPAQEEEQAPADPNAPQQETLRGWDALLEPYTSRQSSPDPAAQGPGQQPVETQGPPPPTQDAALPNWQSDQQNFEPGSLSDVEILAKTIDAEAGNEPMAGKIAVGAVINNRKNAGTYGSSLRDVIMAPGQFSAWNSVTGYAGGAGGLDMVNRTPNEESIAAAKAILSGRYEDPTGGAVNYYNPHVVEPAWGQKAGGNWLTIGNHIFGTAGG